jgi:hypothetical protein
MPTVYTNYKVSKINFETIEPKILYFGTPVVLAMTVKGGNIKNTVAEAKLHNLFIH